MILRLICFSKTRAYQSAWVVYVTTVESTRIKEDEKNVTKQCESEVGGKSLSNVIDIWLQRITYFYEKSDGNSKSNRYEVPLCKRVAGENNTIWNDDWCPDRFRQILSEVDIIDKEALDKVGLRINPDEVAFL